MGMESSVWYNNFCLIGHTDERGYAWHYQQCMQGDEPNHYPKGIPYADVVRRLFGWKPIAARTANLIPSVVQKDEACDQLKGDDGKFLREPTPNVWLPKRDSNGEIIVRENGKPIMLTYMAIEVPDMRGIIRDENYLELGHHSDGYKIHDYEEWLLQLQSNVIGDTLDIWSAILLRNGAQACVQVAFPETVHDDKTGMDFVPYIHAYSSLDGSLSTTFAAQNLLIVCDNTMYCANRNAGDRQYKAKHTSASLESDKIQEVRQALSILHQTREDSTAFFQELAAIKLTRPKWIEVIDIIFPPVEEKRDDSGKILNQKQLNGRDAKKELLDSLYQTDPMACTWAGTALGAMQAVNTYATHHARIMSMSRTQRNMDKITRGEFRRVDEMTLKALAYVLDKPELVEAN